MNTVFEQTETIKSWDEDYYHPIAEQYYDAAVPAMLQMMGVKPGDMVLDAGCGPGVHTIRAANYGCRVMAIDISNAMLSEAKRRVAAAKIPQVEFAQQDLTKLSYPDASFKHVFSWGVVIHIPDAAKALDELARIVAPGGSLALYVTNDNSWDKKIEDAVRGLLRRPLNREKHEFGSGVWYDMHGEKLWVWQFDTRAIEARITTHGMRLTHQVVGEYSQIQWRTKGALRRALLRLNNFLYDKRISPTYAVTNLLVFRKDA